MAAKDVKFGGDARQKMLEGINVLAEAVKVTMDIKADATFAGNNFELSNTYTETGGQQYFQPTTSYETITFYVIPNSNYLGKWQMRNEGIVYMKNIQSISESTIVIKVLTYKYMK